MSMSRCAPIISEGTRDFHYKVGFIVVVVARERVENVFNVNDQNGEGGPTVVDSDLFWEREGREHISQYNEHQIINERVRTNPKAVSKYR